MRRIKAYFARAERGLEAVEGMFVLTAMIFVLVLLLSFGFLLYQRWVVSSVANDAANRIAQSYAYCETDPVTGFIRRTMRQTMSPFRYQTSRLEEKNTDRAENYARWCLDQVSLAQATQEPDIEARTVHDCFAQRHVEVEISATYEIPFGGALEFFGMDKVVTCHAVGYAVCTDVSNYMHSVDTLKSLSGTTFGSKVLGALNGVLAAYQKTIDAYEKISEPDP